MAKSAAKFAYTVNWEEEEEPKGGFLWMAIFSFSFVALTLITYMLVGEGFGTDGAARLQSYVDLSRGEGDYLAENFARIYPLIPFLLGLLFSAVPQVADTAPYYVDSFAAALLLGLGFLRFTKAAINPFLGIVFILLIAANPMFLFVATSGSGIAVALLFVYMFAMGTISLARDASVRGLIMISMAYAGLLLTTPLGFYFLIISVPLLALMSRQKFVTEAPISFFIVLGFVPVAVLASLAFMNWVFVGDLPGLVRSITGGVTAAQAEMGLEPWPFLMGGSPLAMIGVLMAGIFISFPVLALALTGFFAGGHIVRASLMMAAVIILTGLVTTYLGVLSHPAYLWVFAVPLILVALEELSDGVVVRTAAVLALLGGIVGGWWLLGLHPTGDLSYWRAEVGGVVEQVTGIELDLPHAVASANRREAILMQVEGETIPIWGAREDILRSAEGN